MAKHNAINKQISSLQTQLCKLPAGKLVCTRNSNRYKWYLSNGKNFTYLPKKERKLAEQLAKKKYLSLKLEEAVREKRALDYYLRHHCESNKSDELLIAESGYRELLSPYFQPYSKELLDWMNSPYEQNPRNPEQLTHKTSSGHLVRSKSEVLIDMLLYISQIPFRYECALPLGDSILYPDFTIRHPSTGELYYWEHFGRMDDTAYRRNFCTKMQLYTSNGILPGIHLITTFESKEHPLGTETIERIISEYFK